MYLTKINPSKIFMALIVLSFATHFWIPHGIEVILAAVALMFLFFSKGRIRSTLETRYLWIFILSALATVVLAIAHYDLAPDYINQYGKTLGKMAFFAVFIFIVDAVSFQFRIFKIDAGMFAKYCIWVISLSLVLKIITVYASSPPSSIMNVIFGSGRIAYLSGELNPNRADDLFLIHLASLVFCDVILISNNKLEWRTAILSIAVGCYLLTSFYVTGSRAGYVGFAAGFVLVLGLFLACNKRLFWVSAAVLLVAGLFLITNSSVYEYPQKLMASIEQNTQSQIIDEEKKAAALILVNQNSDALKKINRRDVLNACLPVLREYHKANEPYLSFSNNSRLALWKDGVQISKQKPFFGHGEYDHIKLVEAYDFVSRCHILSFSHIHSFYLDLLIRGGVFMLAVFVFLLAYFFFMLLKVAKLNNKTMLIGSMPVFYLTYLMVENLFDMTFIYNTQLYGFALSYAVMCGIFFGICQPKDEAQELS